MSRLLSELRAALSLFRRQPAFSAFVVVTLALALGVNTALFAVVRSVLLQPLPYREPDRLVRVWESLPTEEREFENVSPANFLDWRGQLGPFADLAYCRDTSLTVAGEDREPEEVTAEFASVNFFSVLGVEARYGRTFAPGEGRERVVVLSHDYWRSRFGGDAAAIGRTLLLNREPYRIVGVMPPAFNVFGRPVALWYPQEFEPGEFRRRRYLEVVGRLAPGATREAAQTHLEGLAAGLATEYPRTNAGWTVRLVPLHEQVIGAARRPLLVLLAASACVLLIACANVAALVLARSTRRERELAVRSAIGAGRRDLVRQLVAESFVLALTAAALGYLAVGLCLRALLAREPGDLPRLAEVQVDGVVLAFAAGLAVVTVVFFGLVPALRGSRPMSVGLSEGGAPRSSAGVRHRLVLKVLTVAEVALAVVLLTAATLLLRSFSTLRSTDPGFRAESVAVGRITLDKNGYPEDAQVVAYFDRLLERLRALPGVEAAGAVTTLPLNPVGIDFEIPYDTGRGEAADADRAPQVAYRVVTPGYFAAIGVRQVAGRDFAAADRSDAPRVVIVNRRMAETAWPGESALGKRIGLFDSAPTEYEVVGVVDDVRHYSLGRAPGPELFAPQAQNPWYSSFYVVLRTAPAPETMLPAVRREVLAVDAGQPIADLTTMKRLLADSLARERFLTLLLGLMAGVALFLAVTGVYAVLSYGVAQRRHEIGVRMAVGARRGEVLRLIFREGLTLTLAGLALGLVGARLTTRALASFLHGVGGGDPPTYAAVAGLMIAAALAACFQPARRAASADPVAALRQ